MASEILDRIAVLRSQTRRATLLFAAATSLGVLLLPLAYRGGAVGAIPLLASSVAYLGLAAFRLLGGFQADRQLEFEERFVGFAGSQNRLLASAEGAGKLWKVSCLVQGLARAGNQVTRDVDRPEVLRRSLTSTARLMLPPSVRLTIPVAVVVAGVWGYITVTYPSSRGLYIYLAVVPCLLAIGLLEYRIFTAQRSLGKGLSAILADVVAWAEREWVGWASHGTRRPYQHRLLYLDPILTPRSR